MKPFTKSLFIVLSVLFSFSYAFAETGTETEKNASGGGSSNAQVNGQSFYIDGTYIAGKGALQKGEMTSKGFKLRTGTDGSRVIFSVNTNYSITSLVINGIANYTAKEEGAAIVVTKVEVDGVETTFEGGEFPGKAADTSGKLTISGIKAQQSIAIYFDNSNSDGNQINAAWVVNWERPDATQPTITVSPKAINLVPEATTKLAVKVDPNTFTTAWVSDNEAVATVAEDGTVTAVAVGKANIINRWDTNADVADTAVVTVADFDATKYNIVKQFDFTTMGGITLTIEETAAGNIWNEANTKPNPVYFCTNDGLGDIAVQAVLDEKSRGWSITSAGLTLGNGAGRCAAIGHLKAGQVVEIIYTGSQFFTGSKEDATRKDDGAVKTALNDGIGRAIYKMEEDGLLGFEITKGNAIQKIIVYEEPAFDPATLIANADFEGEYTVYSNPSADRAIYQPAGWTLTYENGEGNDMTALNSDCLAWNSFSGKPQPTNGGNNTYWIRFRWGSNESLTLSQIVKLPAGDYKLSTDAFFNGAKGGSATISAAGQSTAITGNSVWANHSVTFSLAEETEVTIAFNLTQTSQVENIAAFDNFTLTTYDPLADAKATLQDEITAAEALVENAALADGKEELNAAITAAKKALAEATTAEEFSAAIEALKAAEAAFNKAQAVAANAALVAGASIDNPVSAPFVVNPYFEENVNGWSRTGTYQNSARANNQQGDFTGYFWENWNGSAQVNKMYQVIENIPNGVYKLKIAAFVNTLADPNESQFVFANEDKTFLTTGAPTFYEVYTKVEDNTLEIGLDQTEAIANWMGIDNVTLLYFGAEGTVEDAKMAAPKNDWKIAKAAAEAALANEAYSNVTGDERTALQVEILKDEPTTAEAYVAATQALNAVTKAFVDAAVSYNALADANAMIVDLPYADAAKKPEAKAATNAADAATAAKEVLVSLRPYYESNAKAEGVEGAEVIADKIVNADASDGNNGWTISGNMNAPRNNESWTDANGKNDYMYFDGGNWGANSWDVSFSQDVTLEAGKYVLSAIMRASTNVDLNLFAGAESVKAEVVGATGNVFDRGWNYSFVTFDVEAEGTVNIGVRGVTSNVHEWMSFSDFRLVRIEKPAAPEFEPSYGTLWTEEQGSQVDENEFNYITLENKYFKGLVKEGDTIKVAISHVGNQPSSRARIITEGTLNLTIDNAGESKTIQQDMTSADLVLDADEIANIQNGANVVLSWKNMTVAKVDLIEKVEAVKTDYTDYIANADLTDSENKGWDDAGTKGIDGSGIVKASTGATFNFSQTIANLPAGKYKLTAQAAYRYSEKEADEYAAMQTDAITKFAQLYATVGTKNTNALVQNRYDGASDTDLAGEGAVQVNNLWVPNSSNAVKAWFAAGKYVNEVEFNLPADGDVKIGIVKTASPEAGDYTVIGPWTLTRLGDAEEEPEPETIKPGDDVTKFIVNNSFETGDLTGWTVGSSSDTGVKPNSNGTYTTEGCDGDYLFNTWWQGIPITQTITNLPKGKYELKALMANDAITAGNKPCLYLLANGDHSEAFSSPNAGTFAEGTMEFYVTDGTATIGAIGGNADGSFTEAGYYWYKVDNFRLTFVEALPNIDDIEIPEGKMSNAAAQALADAKAAGDVVALLEAVKVAKASIEAYAHLNGVLNELTDILEKTNVYTAEAKQTFDTAFNTAQTGYNNGTISDADAKAFNYGSRLEGLLPSLLLSAYTSTVNGTPYINTWSVEGNNDGTNYLTPFFEYWVGDAESLAENTITATMTNLQNGVYDVTAWVRVRIKNGAEAPATGIFLQANDSEGVSVVGENVTGQFYLKEVAVQAVVESGELKIKFNVAAENNISWLSFKNVKFAYNESATVGIKNVNNAKNANDTIYNLNGQKVQKAQKGLYIINGKKVVIK